MIIVDCKSPLSQKILQWELVKSDTSDITEEYIVTDRDDLKGDNIINLSDFEPPFSIDDILSSIRSRKNIDVVKTEECNCKDEVAQLKKSIFSLIEKHNSKLLKDIEAMLEK